MITFACPACRMSLRVSDDRASRHVKCPYCAKSTSVPLKHNSSVLSPSANQKWALVAAAGVAVIVLAFLLRHWL
jgi:hypothetical protein